MSDTLTGDTTHWSCTLGLWDALDPPLWIVPKGIYGALLLFLVSARTNKRHHHQVVAEGVVQELVAVPLVGEEAVAVGAGAVGGGVEAVAVGGVGMKMTLEVMVPGGGGGNKCAKG